MRYPDHLGLATDLMIIAFEGEVSEEAWGWIGRTPTVPDFAWGNLIVLRRAPRPEEVEVEIARYRTLFGTADDDERYLALAWADRDGAIEATLPFVERGWLAVDSTTLVTASVQLPADANREVEVRRLTSDDDYAQSLAVEESSRPPHEDPQRYLSLCRRMQARYRRLAEAGKGELYGAFEGERCRATLGIFVGPDGTARYQRVVTAADARRRGIAARLVFEAGQRATRVLGARRLVISSATASSAQRIYERCGFTAIERKGGALRRPLPRSPHS